MNTKYKIQLKTKSNQIFKMTDCHTKFESIRLNIKHQTSKSKLKSNIKLKSKNKIQSNRNNPSERNEPRKQIYNLFQNISTNKSQKIRLQGYNSRIRTKTFKHSFKIFPTQISIKARSSKMSLNSECHIKL